MSVVATDVVEAYAEDVAAAEQVSNIDGKTSDTVAAAATFTLLSHEVFLLFKTAMEFTAGADAPNLQIVRMEVRGDQLLAVSTDRYALCVTRTTIPEVEGESHRDVEFNVSAADVKAALPLLKVAKRDEKTVTVTVTIEDQMVRLRRSDDVSSSMHRSELSFPRWRSLVSDATSGRDRVGEDMGYTGRFSASRLAKFVKIRRRDDRILIEPNRLASNRPLAIRVGTHSLGILMPMRGPDGADPQREGWDALL